MLISKRKREPAHYTLKIESFSLLSDANMSKIESDVFEAGGHKWRLDLYPNGNDENKGRHISLYLVICDINSRSKGWEVLVDVNFFVYDHIRHNYVTFQEANGQRTRFHEKKTTWGFDKLISLDSFMEGKNGYLYNDSCVFGAEIIALPEFTQVDRCLVMTKPPVTMNSHTWTINNFPAIKEEYVCSEVFKVGNVKWILSFYPKGYGSGKGHPSIFLSVHDAASFPNGWKVYAKYKFRVKIQDTKSDTEEEITNWFCKGDEWGSESFKPLSQLNDSKNGFFLSDNLTVKVEISVMGTLKNFV